MNRIPASVKNRILKAYNKVIMEDKLPLTSIYPMVDSNDNDDLYLKVKSSINDSVDKIIDKYYEVPGDNESSNIPFRRLDIYVREVLDELETSMVSSCQQYYPTMSSMGPMDYNQYIIINSQMMSSTKMYRPGTLDRVDEACEIVNNVLCMYYNKSTNWIENAMMELSRYNNPIADAIFAWSII